MWHLTGVRFADGIGRERMNKHFVAWLIRLFSGIRRVPAEMCPAGSAIYFANHSSHLDFLTIWAAFPEAVRSRTRPVAGRDYWEKTAIRRRIARDFFNAVLIERQRVTVASNPLEPMVAALDAGSSLIVFPEGTRSPDGKVHPFKPGLHHVARARPEVPLVPVYLQDLSRILPKGDILPVPLIANLSIGGPMRLESGEPKQDFLLRAQRAVEQLSR
jgi:1-acyl-sn-glycerol-3-phosphate acyltransferase